MTEQEQTAAERLKEKINSAPAFWGEFGQALVALAAEVETLRARVKDLERARPNKEG
jgi:hypothetical protein